MFEDGDNSEDKYAQPEEEQESQDSVSASSHPTAEPSGFGNRSARLETESDAAQSGHPHSSDPSSEEALWASIYNPYIELARVAFRGLRDLPLMELSHAEQLDLVSTVAPLRSELESMIAESLLVIDRSGASIAEHGLPSQKWMSDHTGDSRSASRRLLSLGRALRHFPLFDAAINDGRISVDHAHVLAAATNPRVLSILQAAEEELVELATKSTVEQWRKDLRALIDHADMDGREPELPKRQDEATIIYDETGRLIIRGEFHGPSAVTLSDLINTEVSRQLRNARSERDAVNEEIPAPRYLRGRALAELLRRGAKPGKDSKTQTDAVLVLDSRSALHPIQTLNGDDVDPVTAAILLCDAAVSPLQVSEDGHPLYFGRTKRFASPEQRWALTVRDGGCVFPGCDAPATWCDAHHVITWERDGGPTDIDNMVLLCRRHHGLVHSQDWDLIPGTLDGASLPHENKQQRWDNTSTTGPPVLIHNPTQRRHDIMNAQTRNQRGSHRRSQEPERTSGDSDDPDSNDGRR